MSTNPCPRCGAAKPSNLFACKPCWFALPKTIRDKIWRAFRNHGAMSEQWLAARDEALAHWGIRDD